MLSSMSIFYQCLQMLHTTIHKSYSTLHSPMTPYAPPHFSPGQAYQNGQLSSAIEGERVAREKADAGLVQQIDALSLSLSKETQERKASDAEIAARQAELESTLNLKIDSAIQTERATRASELAELMARLESLTSSQDELEQTTALRLAAGIEREKADREKAQAGLAQQVSALSLSLDEESKAREALGLDMLARQAQLESALTRKIDSAIEGENADRKAAYAELSSKIDAFSLSLGKELETERAQREAADIAHQEEARRILDEIAAAPRIRHIPCVSGNEMNVEMEDCLSSSSTHIYPYIVAIRMKTFIQFFFGLCKQKAYCVLLILSGIEIGLNVPFGNDENMPLIDRIGIVECKSQIVFGNHLFLRQIAEYALRQEPHLFLVQSLNRRRK
jgi:polyhydroxyalkanoate synthesis regulator phasin